MVFTRTGPKHQGRKGQYVGHRWYDDLVLLDDDERTMPQTISHEEISTHQFGCECTACVLYPMELRSKLKRRARSAARSRQ